jgi:hypothetical protein
MLDQKFEYDKIWTSTLIIYEIQQHIWPVRPLETVPAIAKNSSRTEDLRFRPPGIFTLLALTSSALLHLGKIDISLASILSAKEINPTGLKQVQI